MFEPKKARDVAGVSQYEIIESDSGTVVALLDPETSIAMRICVPLIQAHALCSIFNAEMGVKGPAS